jgi:RNA polymerase sigma factor (sigma-70 family)
MTPACDDSAAAATCSLDVRLIDLMNRYQTPLLNFLLAIVGDYDLAHDCAQETFVRAYDNLRRGKDVNRAWLYKVGRNIATDEFRRKTVVKAAPDALEELPGRETEMPARDVTVREAMAQLSIQESELLYLHIIDRLKTAEIARMLGVRPATVRMRLLRARVRFREVWRDAR